MHPIRRHGKKRGKKSERHRVKDPTSESHKWWNLVSDVHSRVGDKKIIHVMDAEGDAYEFLTKMREANKTFVIRLSQDKRIENESEKTIYGVLNHAPIIATREVHLSNRSRLSTKSSKYQPRKRRLAKLAIRVSSVTVKKPNNKKYLGLTRTIALNVVHVFEIDPPEGCEAIDWKLVTSESIGNEEAILRIVDIYRKRWIIEEYFKALKTGCGFEKRELQSYKTLLTALALLVPVAYRLLLIRHMSRTEKKVLAESILTKAQIVILRAEIPKSLSNQPTIEEAFLAIAKLGGHIKNNGDPGWIVLGRGYEELLILERGYALAVARQEQVAQCNM